MPEATETTTSAGAHVDTGKGADAVLDPAEELKRVNAVLEKDVMKVGDTYYLLAAHWFAVWSDYANAAPDLVSSDVIPSRPGPIDNSALLEADGTLKPKLLEKNDYELLPEEAWKLFFSWYGGEAVSRKVIAVGMQQKAQVELYPITVKVLYGKDVTEVTASRVSTFSQLRHQVCTKHNIPPHKYAMFVIEQDEDEAEATASEIGEQLMQSTLEEFQVENDQLFEVRAGSASLMLTAGTGSTSASSTSAASSTATVTYASHWSSRVSHSEGSPKAKGACGLANLGNTCFMNSALQCLSNTIDLTQFFLSDGYEADVNEENPLGTKGFLVRAYAALMKDMWSDKYTSVAPVEFKKTLGKFAPQFSGYQQQDSQELLSFLLDGLHEDLNRVRDKPYVEAVESNGRPDEVVSAESWEAYLKRNDSKVVELFQGQLKSKLVCPDCQRVSITFDPLMYLSLPIPTTTDKVMQVLYWPPDAAHHSQLQRFGFSVPKMSTMKEFREVVAKHVGLPPAQVVVADVYTGRPFMQGDIKIINDCRTTGYLMAYGVDPVPVEERIIVPIVQRRPSTYSKSSKSLASHPAIIAVRKEKTSYKELHERATALVKKLMGEECPEFTLTICKEYGTTCGKCPYTSGCKGCALPDGEELVPSTVKIAVGVDWKEDECDSIFDEQKKWTFKEDDSCKTTLEQAKDTIALEECLELFTREETLGAEDTVYCSNCKEFKQSTKKFDLWKLPEVLVIHLKRFQYSRFFRDKISTDVVFPIKGLKLSEYTQGPDSDTVYDLFAVSNHMGGIGGGHYTAFAQNQGTGQWFEFNDRHVSEMSEEKIGGEKSYVLFYRKRARSDAQ